MPGALETATVETVSHATTTMRELGICSTCRHQPRCLFAKAARQTIWLCEEFETAPAAAADSPALAPVALANPGEGQPEGLCENCAERSDCLQRQPGVLVTECANFS